MPDIAILVEPSPLDLALARSEDQATGCVVKSLHRHDGAQALTLFEGRDFVTPETIQDIAPDIIAHRLVLTPEAKFNGLTSRAIVNNILETTPVPV